MLNNLDEDWKAFLKYEFDRSYFNDLQLAVNLEYIEQTVYPPKQDVFNAFNFCTLENLKVVLIGQDPYHGEDQANGLCFSVRPNQKLPPSLNNVFKELKSDLNIKPKNGDLSHWAGQGVLMLNTVLTVRKGEANSHSKLGWRRFTKAVIKNIADERKGIVFLLWGGQAHKFEKLIDSNRHFVLKSGHPSPLSANRGFWFGNKHFSKTNDFLFSVGKSKIDW